MPARAYGVDDGRPLSQLRLDTWSMRDGLPSRVINAVAQTPDGFIWLGTSAGLIRFDGVSFDVYDRQNTPSLPNDYISALKVARDGTLWVGMDWGGFGRFVGGKFLPGSKPDKNWSRIYSIAQDKDGSLWIGEWGGVPVRHVVGGKVIGYRDLHTADPGVNVLVPLGDGRVLCGMPWDQPKILSPDGTVVKTWQGTSFSYPCNDICHTSDGAFWYGVGRTGVWRIKDGKVQHFTTKDGLASNVVTKLYVDRADQLWVGTSNGVSVWNGKGFQSFGKLNGLYDSVIGAVTQDMEGNIWVASGVGLNRFASTKLRPFTLSVGTDTASINSNTAISPAASGGIWCASSMGLWRLRTDSVVRCHFADALSTHFEGVKEGPDGRLWLWRDNGNQSYDLWCVTPTAKSDHTSPDFLAGAPKAGSYTVQKIRVPGGIFADIVKPGLLIAFYRSKAYTISPDRMLRSVAFPGGFQFTAREDRAGVGWIGDTNGLIRFENGHSAIVNNGMPENTHVLGIDASDPKRIWLATDHGLGRFENGSSTVFGIAAGLPDTNLYQVLRDGSGRIWVGSNFGIFWMSEADIDAYQQGRIRQIPYHAYQATDGIRSFPSGDAERTSEGSLWFGSDKGATLVDPKDTSINTVPPPMAIETATLDKIRLATRGVVTVPPGQGFLTIRYAALSFAAPERVRFRYKLDGLDQRWIDAGNRRIAVYPYLPPGHYRFEVVACNNDGVWNTNGASLSFVLKPHPYQTNWFKFLVAIGAGIVLGLLYYIRVRGIVLRNRELEVKVAERTTQLQESNEQLKAAQEKLESQYMMVEDRNHELEAMHGELEAQNEELRAMQESLAEANEHLAALAVTDGLTGLKNHRSFQEQLEVEWERRRRYSHEMSLILLDIDLFKQYNDSFGHQTGDDVLKKVASIISHEARESDLVARYGGEEFVIILPETDSAGASALAERMRAKIEDAEWEHRPVTASFGVATATSTIASGPDLFTHADAALFWSKEHGRNCVAHASDLAKEPLRRAG